MYLDHVYFIILVFSLCVSLIIVDKIGHLS